MEEDYIHQINLCYMHQTKQKKLFMIFFFPKICYVKKFRSTSKEDIDLFFFIKKKKRFAPKEDTN